jgi:hypothetical protein
MSKWILKMSFALAALTLSGVACQAQVLFNASVGVEFAPGVFGRINIGNAAPPPLIYAQPVMAGQPVYGAQPVYVYAPIEEIQNWGYYCNKYSACGYPVYFIHYEEHHPFWASYHEMHRPGLGFEHREFEREREHEHEHEERREHMMREERR